MFLNIKKKIMYTALCVAFLFLVVSSVTAQDETETSNATGEGVVGAVLERFRNTEFETNETKLCFFKKNCLSGIQIWY